MPIARYYDESKNDGRAFDGVPLHDLTEEEFAELPAWLQASVDAAPFYRKTKPRAEKAEGFTALKEDPGDGIEKIGIEAPADGTETELVVESSRKRR